MISAKVGHTTGQDANNTAARPVARPIITQFRGRNVLNGAQNPVGAQLFEKEGGVGLRRFIGGVGPGLHPQ